MVDAARIDTGPESGGADRLPGWSRDSRFRTVLGHFPTGVVVVTALDALCRPVGMSAGTFTSVSLDPPLVAFLAAVSSTSYPRIRASGSFCINVLSADQEPVCRSFAASGSDKFAGIGWRPAGSGSPLLDGVVAWIDCDIDIIHQAGDHDIVIGRVRDLDVASGELPLLFFRGGFGQFAHASLTAPAQPDLLEPLRAVDRIRVEMEQLASALDVECLAVAAVGDQLVVVGSAGSQDEIVHHIRIGQRMPFIAPLAAPLVAWAPRTAVDAWLAPIPGSDEHRPAFERLLELVGHRGWSLALASDELLALEASVANQSIGITASELDDARTAVLDIGADTHEPEEDIDPGRDYHVGNLSAPVFGGSGEAVLQLSLYGLPVPVSGAELVRYRDALLAAARRASQALSQNADASGSRS